MEIQGSLRVLHQRPIGPPGRKIGVTPGGIRNGLIEIDIDPRGGRAVYSVLGTSR
jgi:hypothetical protein